MRGIDTSNYTGVLTPELCSGAREAGYDLLLPQAVAPPGPYPPGVTPNHLACGFQAGMFVAPYVWLWFGLSLDDIKRKLDLLNGYEGRCERLWLDVEDTSLTAFRAVRPPHGAVRRMGRFSRRTPTLWRGTLDMSLQARLDAISAALELLDAFPTKIGPAGIYTGVAWYWDAYLNSSAAFTDRALWNANYDGIASVNQPAVLPWGTQTLKQYKGTTDLETPAGVIPQVDLSIVSVQEEARMTQTDPPTPDVDWGWQEKKIPAVEAAGRNKERAAQIRAAADRQTASGNYAIGKGDRETLHNLADGVEQDATVITG